MLATPASDAPFDAADAEKKAWETKQKLLAAFDDALEAAAAEGGEAYDNKTVFRVISNVQVEIGVIHIRFEDLASAGGEKIAAGLTLEGVSIRSAKPSNDPSNPWVPIEKGDSENET